MTFFFEVSLPRNVILYEYDMPPQLLKMAGRGGGEGEWVGDVGC